MLRCLVSQLPYGLAVRCRRGTGRPGVPVHQAGAADGQPRGGQGGSRCAGLGRASCQFAFCGCPCQGRARLSGWPVRLPFPAWLACISPPTPRQLGLPCTWQVFEAMEAAREAIEDAKPLLQQAVKLSDEVSGERVGREGEERYAEAGPQGRTQCFQICCVQHAVLVVPDGPMLAPYVGHAFCHQSRRSCRCCRSCGRATWWAMWRRSHRWDGKKERLQSAFTAAHAHGCASQSTMVAQCWRRACRLI